MKKISVYFVLCVLLLIYDKSTAQGVDGNGYHLYSIFFGGGSYLIDTEQEKGLKEFLESIPGVHNYQIVIHSHTDNIGSLEYNQWLSEMRGTAAIVKLQKLGIAKDNIVEEDFGEVNPIFDNDTWTGKLKNRRVDIMARPAL